MATPPKLYRMRCAIPHYVRAQLGNFDAQAPTHGKVHPLEAIADDLTRLQTMNEKVRFLLHFRDQTDFVEFAMISPFESWTEIVQGLESRYSRVTNDEHVLKPELGRLPLSASLLANGKEYPHDELRSETIDPTEPMMSSSTCLESRWQDSDLGFEFVSSQGDETTDSSEFELLPSESAQKREQKIIRVNGHDRDGNTFNKTTDPLSAAKLDPGEFLCDVGAEFAADCNIEESFPGNAGHLAGLLGLDYERSVIIGQDYTLFGKFLREMPRVANNIRPTPEEIQFHCLTQGSIGRGTCDLYLHQGHNRFIGRWKFDSVIPYSIDYKSFSTKGRSKRDANYALKSLQTALGVWNSFNIGVQFKFVKPNASPIVFKLKYKHEPEDGDTDLKVFAESFFPARAMLRRRPCKLYIFGVSFERSFRRYMMRTFLHEAAHILGGRHENPAPADRGYPFVLLDSQNDMSVLVTHRHPRTISMHWQDIKSFSDFMSLPEGHKINGVPIRDIVP